MIQYRIVEEIYNCEPVFIPQSRSKGIFFWWDWENVSDDYFLGFERIIYRQKRFKTKEAAIEYIKEQEAMSVIKYHKVVL